MRSVIESCAECPENDRRWCAGVSRDTPAPSFSASARLEVPLRQLLPKQPLAPVMLRNAVIFGALGATISLGAPLALKNIGL